MDVNLILACGLRCLGTLLGKVLSLSFPSSLPDNFLQVKTGESTFTGSVNDRKVTCLAVWEPPPDPGEET